MKTVLYEVDTSKSPQELSRGKDKISIVKFRVYAQTFPEWVASINAYWAGKKASEAVGEKAMRVFRRAQQVRAVDSEGVEHAVTSEELLRLPRKLYVAVMSEIAGVPASEKGDLVGAGDGIDEPVTYRLGQPILLEARSEASDKAAGKQAITELEFLARTGADIEDVLCEPTMAGQMLALIQSCARPIIANAPPELKLMRLPSFALDQIGMSDGVDMIEKVLPRFLEEDA